MQFKDITTWVVTTDHQARPKNIYAPTVSTCSDDGVYDDYPNEFYNDFETFATQHTYHCSPSLVAGEYPAADVELVWQQCMAYSEGKPSVTGWQQCCHADAMADQRNGWDVRQYLQLKQPVPKEITERKTDLGLTNNIEPCPFCGGTEGEQVFLGRTEPDHFQITCICCSIKMKHDRKDKVIGIWNNRKLLSDFN